MNSTEAKNVVTPLALKNKGQLLKHSPTGMMFSVVSVTMPHMLNGVEFPQLIQLKNVNSGDVIFRAPNDVVQFEVMKRGNPSY